MFAETQCRKGDHHMPDKVFELVEASAPDYLPKPEEPDEIECEDDEVF